MGAMTFITRAKGRTAQAAFDVAVAQAQYDHGHAGYTGTIAEKRSFKLLGCPGHLDPLKEAQRLIDEDHPVVTDKWGPAACFDLGSGEFLFFGWASS